MPYEIHEQQGAYEVINSKTGEVKATHEPPNAKEKAENQVEALNALENDESWGEE
jgi:hypothetical protein